MSNLSVVQGQKRSRVGTIPAAVGMETNQGRIERLSPSKATAFTAKGKFLVKTLSITLTEARKLGYPDAPGSQVTVPVSIRRRVTSALAS